jgi:AraC-like DNA-binding protein
MRISRRAPQLEVIPSGAAQSFAVLEHRTTHFPFFWHRHPEWELTLILSGDGTRFVGDHVEPYHGGDLCLVAPDVPHSWSSEPSPRVVARAVVVQFPAHVVEAVTTLPEGARIGRLLERARGGMAWPASAASARLSTMKRLPEGIMRFVVLVETLELLAQRQGRPLASHIAASSVDRRLHRVLGLVEEELADRISQRSVARTAGMSPGAFSRFFHNATGRTFVRYVAERRVARSCRDLLETDDRVLDIALRHGFGSISTFNRCFMSIKATTPRAFRKAR